MKEKKSKKDIKPAKAEPAKKAAEVPGKPEAKSGVMYSYSEETVIRGTFSTGKREEKLPARPVNVHSVKPEAISVQKHAKKPAEHHVVNPVIVHAVKPGAKHIEKVPVKIKEPEEHHIEKPAVKPVEKVKTKPETKLHIVENKAMEEKPVVLKKALLKKPVVKAVLKKPILNGSEVKIPEVVKNTEIKKNGHPALVFKKHDDKISNYYGDTGIVLLTRDPYWMFSYWEVSLPRIDQAKRELGDDFNGARSILRVYEVTNVIFNGNNAHGYFDIQLENMATSWYLNVYAPEKTWVVDIGLLTRSGRFYVLARSNSVSTPADHASDWDYEEWMDSSESWKMYMTRAGKKLGDEAMLSASRPLDATSVGGVSSLSSPVKYEKKPSAFWMRVGTELIVYGATEPDAAVTINRRKVDLNPDGSFSTRFALVDGVHTLDIIGKSKSGEFKKSFKIVVEQNTTREE